MKNAVKLLIAALLTISLLAGLSALFLPSRNLAENRWEYAPSNYYASGVTRMPKNSLDVVFIGSSQVYSAVSPMEMWKTQGVAGYCLSTSGQTAPSSYYYLLNCLRRQTPKVVAVDLLALFEKPAGKEFNNRSAVDNLPLSPEKLRLAGTLWAEQQNGESFFSYLAPVLRYHGRWKELKDADFSLKRDYDYARGYDMRYGSRLLQKVTREDFPMLTRAPTEEEEPVEEAAAEYYRRMADVCREKGIRLLLFRTPCAGTGWEQDNAMRRFAQACGADFLDFNDPTVWDAMNFQCEEDMLDSMHLNVRGTKKLSAFLGELLRRQYDLPDHRGEEAYAFWERDRTVYEAELRAWEIQNCGDAETLRELTMNGECALLAVGMENAEAAFADALGAAPNPESMWIAFADGEETRLVYTDSLTGFFRGMEYEIDDTGIYMHGKNYMVGSGGLYYVVYDDTIGKIVDYGSVYPDGRIERQ